MDSSSSKRLSELPGYDGHVEINADFQLLENSTAQSPEVMAEVCGVLIGYLRAGRSSLNKVTSVSVVFNALILYVCPTNTGYLLIQFSRAQKLSGVRRALDSILGEEGDPSTERGGGVGSPGAM